MMKARKNPFLAGLLNVALFLSGPGYFYIGQRRKGWLALAAVAGLQLVNFGGTLVYQGVTTRILWPLIWAFQLLTFLDAFLLARRANAGEAIGPGEVAVPALRWIGRT